MHNLYKDILNKLTFSTILIISICFYFTNINATNITSLTTLKNIKVIDFNDFNQLFYKDIEPILKKEFDKENIELQNLAKKVEKQQSKFKKDRTVMTKEEVEKITSELMGKQTELQQKAALYQQKATQRQQEEFNARSELLKKVIENISTKNNYDAVVAKQAFAYIKSSYDITEEVKLQYKKELNDATKKK